MCVIIIKPAGVKMPSKSELLSAHRYNPHGMGFASPSQNYKGLSFEQFYKKLKKVHDSEPCIIHFRLATHGSIKRANCHPFKAVYHGADLWFMHNGILNIEPYKDMTDSETAFRYVLMPVIEKYGLESKEVSAKVNEIIGASKFAFLHGQSIRMFGNFIKDNECFYSNLRHRHNYYRLWAS